MFYFKVFILLTISTLASIANSSELPKAPISIEKFFANPMQTIDTKIKDPHTFYGLASYYNNVEYFVLSDGTLMPITENDSILLEDGQWLAAVGRFSVLLMKAPGTSLNIQNRKLSFADINDIELSTVDLRLLSKRNLLTSSSEFSPLRYSHLWAPLAWAAKAVEASLNSIHSTLQISWGWTLVAFAILLKILLLPVGIMTVRFQRRVSQVQAKLAPVLANIKTKFEGEEAHNHLMAAHAKLGVSPFYTLKPIIGSFIQIPILIAVFNALGEMQQFSGQSFLWINDLAYPDAIINFQIIFPLFGDALNLLPFIMTIVAIFATILFQNRHAPLAEIKRQKRNLYIMAGAFFLLFYPFPAVMVLYWTLANIIQTIQQNVVKI